jgi:hypothetical protein
MVIYSNGPGDIFVKWRNLTNKINEKLGELFSCMMCFPFWVGAILSAIDLFLFGGLVLTPYNVLILGVNGVNTVNVFTSVFIIFMDGVLSSGTTWIVHNIEEYFETKG